MDLGLERFLELVKKDLGAEDARIELGGKPPTNPDLLWCEVPGCDARVVAVMSGPVRGRLELEHKLTGLAEGFAGTIDRSAARATGRPFEGSSTRARLDAELSALVARAGAARAAVFDTSSPMIWGASLLEDGANSSANLELERWVEELRSDRAEELKAAHGHVVRLTLDSDSECLARMFGGLYVLALTFEATLSEPVAVGALLHAAETIERLVFALPPVDPPPGGKVIRLPKRGQ